MSHKFKAVVRGDRLMMRNVRLVDPLDEYTKRIAIVSKKSKKSEEEHAILSRLDWEGGLYFDEKIGPYVPGRWLFRAIRDGAAKRKLGKEIYDNFRITEDVIPLEYAGPRTVEAMWAAGSRFADRRSVCISKKRVMRTRPIFRDWRLTFSGELDECGIDLDGLEEALDEAATRGIGDGHTVGMAGKFIVESFEEIKETGKIRKAG